MFGITKEQKKAIEEMYLGKKVRILSMEGEPRYSGKMGVIEHVDDLGQLHGTWGGCAIAPYTDIFEVIE